MKLTNTSINNMNIENSDDTTAVPDATPIPIFAKININNVNTITIMWPPIILANKRTVNAAGLVNIPNTSMIGMIGSGNFSHRGTSGQNTSFQ